jgi:hypothetical protein
MMTGMKEFKSTNMKRKKGVFETQESVRMKELIKNSNIFYGDAGGKLFPTKNGLKPKPDYLLNSRSNLVNFIVQDVIDYFVKNEIAFWKTGIASVDEYNMPTGHTLSSQIACLNHLYPLRNDKNAVLSIAQTICPDFTDVLTIKTDKYLPAYIAFEVVSDTDHLNEKCSSRGTMCTSVDALIYAEHKDGKKYLVPVEWKYTECYSDKDYSIEDRKEPKFEKEGKGKERLRRYSELITNSPQLKTLCSYENSVYFFEPFYQLMRQTLWAEQIIAHKDSETMKADDFIHIHVIPQENKDLLNKTYRCSDKGMEETWRENLQNQNKYQIVTPKELLGSIDKIKYGELINYLTKRYWTR